VPQRCRKLNAVATAFPYLLTAATAYSLYRLSAWRYLTVLIRHALVAYTCVSAIDPWHVVMLAPAVQCLALIAITPGALGVVEWGWAGLLGMTASYSLAHAAAFALALRLTFVLSLAVIVVAGRCWPRRDATTDGAQGRA